MADGCDCLDIASRFKGLLRKSEFHVPEGASVEPEELVFDEERASLEGDDRVTTYSEGQYEKQDL